MGRSRRNARCAGTAPPSDPASPSDRSRRRPDARADLRGPRAGQPRARRPACSRRAATPARARADPAVRPPSPPVPGQLPLPFAPLPALAIEPDWKDQPRLWGHAYHPMCSYLASFPAALAHAFIARYTRPGDVVLDPFSGRGTTPLQACAEGRIGVGNDLNPLAHVLTAAKVEPPTGRELEARLAGLRIDWSFEARRLAGAGRRAWRAGRPPPLVPGRPARRRPRATATEPVPAEVALAFHPRTLGQLLFVRSRLRPRRSGRPVPGRRPGRDPPRQAPGLPLRADAEHVQHGPAVRARLRGADGLRRARARPLRPPRREAPPPRPRRPPGGARDRAPRRRPRRGRPGPRGPRANGRSRTGRGSSSPRRPTCGSSSTATTTGSGPGSSASPPRRSTRPSTTPTGASRTSSSCARSWPACARPSPTTPSSPWSSATSRRSAAGPRPTGSRSAWPTRPGRAPRSPEGYLLAGVVRDEVAASRQDDEAVGRRGRAGDEGGPDPGPRARRRPAGGAPSPGRRVPVDWSWPPRR